MQANLIEKLYDPGLFEAVSRVITEETRRHLETSSEEPYRSLKPPVPDSLVRQLGNFMVQPPEGANDLSPESIVEHARELARAFLSQTNPLHSPHYMGHQVPPPIPIASAFAAAGAVSNPGAAVFEMGQTSIAAEKALSEQMGLALGWKPGTFDSVVTHGGSLANLTAVLSARNTHFKRYWKEGSGVDRRGAILVSQDAHYSIARSAGIVGLGSQAVFKVALDSKRRMDVKSLSNAYGDARAQGYEPFCVVSSSCSTPIGAFDPIGALADFARDKGLWLHVDAAHGGGMLLSRRHRKLLAGIDQADSVTWDAHKMMFVPALSTFLFYRDAARSYAPFEQDAPYLFDPDADDSMAYDPGLRTVECTKGPLSLVLWALWSLFGPEAIETLVDRTIETTRSFYSILRDTPDFVALHEPECNIQCFRYLPDPLKDAPLEKVSTFQFSLRQALLKSGRFYITGTRLDEAYALRTVLMNPKIGISELQALLSEIRSLGRQLL